MDSFKTFQPRHPTLRRYVEYYYLDEQADNVQRSIECFPHWNTTISLYASHRFEVPGKVSHVAGAAPLQIFTPLRSEILRVRQYGPVKRIVIVFRPLGVQQFFPGLTVNALTHRQELFPSERVSDLFTGAVVQKLEELLLERFKTLAFPVLTPVLNFAFEDADPTVDKFAALSGYSRRHISRLFQRYLGVSARAFIGIVRFRRAVNHQLFRTPESLTHLAYAQDFADQSHLVKTFRRWTEKPPREFFHQGTRFGDHDTFWRIKAGGSPTRPDD